MEGAGPDRARLDELDQLVRIALRKQEIVEEEAAKQKSAPKDGPLVIAEDKGFALRTADGAYNLRIAGLVQSDARFFFKDDALAANDTFLIRRFRPSIEGTLFSLVDYRLVPELAGTVQILDAYADLHPTSWLRFRMGRFKGPIGLERLQSDADLSLVERSLDQNLSSTRELGLQVWGNFGGGVAQYALGVFNGNPEGGNLDADVNHAKDVAGRIFVQPFQSESLREAGTLGFGLAYSFGDRKGRLPSTTVAAVTGLGAFRTAGQNTFFQYFAPATDTTGATTTFGFQRTSHLNPQLYYFYKNFGLLGEYVLLRQGVQRGGSTATLSHHATHATLSFAFNGRVGFDGITPDAPFNLRTGAVGAFEFAARWAWLKVDPKTFGDATVAGSVQYADPLKSVRAATAWTVGFSWIPRRSLHVALDYEQTSFEGGAGTTTLPADRKTENVFIARTQVNF